MKKIPLLFVRDEDGAMTRVVTPGMEWVADGDGEATEKVDGSACAIIEGRLYKRYDANVKRGRRPPIGAIPCQPEPDPFSGHWPFWVLTDSHKREDAWFINAQFNSPWNWEDGTYEAVGKHFNGNPYGLDDDFLERHGRIKLKDCPRDYDGLYDFLREREIEGVVFWKDGKPQCKIRRKDFGLPWPVKTKGDS